MPGVGSRHVHRYSQHVRAIAYRYLVQIPGVCKGRTIVEGTRIGVHDVVGLIVNGATIDDVLRSLPDLTRAQVYECLAFYEDHRPDLTIDDDAVLASLTAHRRLRTLIGQDGRW